MSSSRDAGHYAEQTRKASSEKCPSSKAKGKKHSWKTEGLWPSVCYVCRHCKTRQYSK